MNRSGHISIFYHKAVAYLFKMYFNSAGFDGRISPLLWIYLAWKLRNSIEYFRYIKAK